MASVNFAGVTRRFGKRAAVDGISLSIADGECLALLGPSGCGKTTLLRLVAGFEEVDEGEIRIGDRRASAPGAHVDPEDRNVGVVFQSYALWPHLNVAGNVGYAARVRGLPRAEREARTAEALRMVGLEGAGSRRVQELSGGQRQRVALARCLAMQPRVVLLDEPLANLDAHLREAMVEEFRRFHELTRATMIYVTHDQGEAMALADRIAVMHEGRLHQVATPRTLYTEPASSFAADFVGQGTVLPVEVIAIGPGGARVRLWGQDVVMRCATGTVPGRAIACLRPEDVRLGSDGIPTIVRSTRYGGDRTRLDLAPTVDPERRLVAYAGQGGIRTGSVQTVSITGGWILPREEAPH